LEKVGGLHSELCPASSHDAYLANSIKAEVLSDAEAEEDPLSITSPGIKAELEVSSVSVSMLEGFHKFFLLFFFIFLFSNFTIYSSSE
jgi:hypothetical protein